MIKFFECTVKIEKLDKYGERATKTEKHVVSALSFSEAEARITKGLAPEVVGDFTVKSIRAKKYEEVLRFPEHLSTPATDSSLDKWFELKVNFFTADNKGREVKMPFLYLVQAGSVNGADAVYIYKMIGSMIAYRVEKISETKIIEVFDFDAKN